MKRRFRGGQQRANVSWYKLAAQKLTPALCRATFRTKAFYTARAANAAAHAASKKLFSKCLVEGAVVRHHGEPDHNGNKRYLRNALNEADYVEGRSVTAEYHWLEGQYDRLPAVIADLVRRRVAVIATGGFTQAAL